MYNARITKLDNPYENSKKSRWIKGKNDLTFFASWRKTVRGKTSNSNETNTNTCSEKYIHETYTCSYISYNITYNMFRARRALSALYIFCPSYHSFRSASVYRRQYLCKKTAILSFRAFSLVVLRNFPQPFLFRNKSSNPNNPLRTGQKFKY